MSTLHLHRRPIFILAMLLSVEVCSFAPSSFHSSRSNALATALPVSASLSYLLNDTLANNNELASFLPPLSVWNNTLAGLQTDELDVVSTPTSAYTSRVDNDASIEEQQQQPSNVRRTKLKRELAHAAITGFHPDVERSISSSVGQQRTAEDIMKELEQSSPLPILQPATHHSLNANWSFVFTGVPTIGMRLITLLSRISVLFPFEILDFRNVALLVEEDQRKAKALVEVQVCGGLDLVLEVCTSLRRPSDDDLKGEYKEFSAEEGTLLLEHFQGIKLNGIKIPTPESWSTTRTLEITYMDKDIMIARTSGGEPHLLLRNTPLCYTPEDIIHVETDNAVMMDEVEECDLLDGTNRWTEFFSEAIEIYGERITRCLVDRDFGKEEYTKKNSKKGPEEWWKSISSGLKLGQQWGVDDD